jgi:hypothetical protein
VQRRSLVFVGFRPGDPDLLWLSSWLAGRPHQGVPHFLFLDVAAEADPDTEVSVWGLRTGLEVIACLDGTGEAVDRLAKISASIAAQLPPSEADIDFGIWLDRWAQDPANQEARNVLARIEAALREDERWDRLVELLLRRLELQDSEDEQLESLREVARVFRDLLNAPERAMMSCGSGCAPTRPRAAAGRSWSRARARWQRRRGRRRRRRASGARSRARCARSLAGLKTRWRLTAKR